MKIAALAAVVLAVANIGAGESFGAKKPRLSSNQQASKPVRDTKFHVDGLPEPASTLDELWGRSDVVIEGTVTAVRAADVQSPDSDPPRVLLYTDYDIAIAEVFKPDARVTRNATVVRVKRRGGIRDRDDHILRSSQEGFPFFRNGERYILFLKYLTREFYAVESPDSAFLLTEDGIKALGKSALADTLAAGPDYAFRTILRRRGGAR